MDRLYGAISLAKKAGKLTAGHDAVCEKVLCGEAALVLLAGDLSARTEKNVRAVCEGLCRVKTLPYTQDDIAPIVHRRAGVLAVTDNDLAVLCLSALPDKEETD